MAEEIKTEAVAAESTPMPPDRSHPEGVNVKPMQDTARGAAEIDKAISGLPTQPTQTRADGIDGLLTEFDRAVPNKLKPEANSDPLRLNEPLTQEHAILNYLSAIEQERLIARDRADFELAVQEASKAIGDAPNVPKDYARLRIEQWAKNEYASNPDFQRAWDNRYTTQDAAQFVTRTVNRAIGNLKKEVQSMPAPIDPEATADRAAVAAAVRGTSTKMTEPPPPRYGDMNDADFKKELAKFGL